MAKNLPTSSDPAMLRSSRGALDRRWANLSIVFCDLLGLPKSDVLVFPEYQSGGAWTGLSGNACERVSRNLGGDVFVAPLCDLPKKLVSWVGFQEVWDLLGGQKPFVFRQSSLTVHIGFVGDPIKPQIFRAEWMGVQDWNGDGVGFHSPDAGHPHWQIDVLQTLRELPPKNVFDPEAADQIGEFGLDVDAAPSIDALLKQVTLENMHFASAAPWWSLQEQGARAAHLNVPQSEADLTRWMSSCIRYIKQELLRCRVRSAA